MTVYAASDMTVITPLTFETFKNIYFASRIETRVATNPIVKAARGHGKKR